MATDHTQGGQGNFRAAAEATAPETKTPSPASPGDNRGAGDLDGNKAAGNGKAKGPNEPPPASNQQPLQKKEQHES